MEEAAMMADQSSTELESLKKIMAAKDLKIEGLEVELRRQEAAARDIGLMMERIQELEDELETKSKTESRMADSLASQNRQLESTMFEFQESKIVIESLQEKIDGLEYLCSQMSEDSSDMSTLKSELAEAREGERIALSKAESLAEEMELLKKEWKFAIEGEDQSSKAMEDLAMALKEVATEANEAKEQLRMKGEELSETKQEVEKMKAEVVAAQQETEAYRQTAEKLRAETEETLFAWNSKEVGFMSCIRRAEEEKAVAQIEKHKLAESLKAAENMTRAAREDTYKLRDILKQSINECNAAKAAAGIARDENSLLKDCLAEKEEALHFITRENERLRISEAAAQEHVKQLKRMLTMASAEIKIDDKEQVGFVMFTKPTDEEEEEEEQLQKKVKREFSFDLEDLKFMNEADDDEEYVLDEDPEKAEALKGSIFDTNAETPESEARTPKTELFRHKLHSHEGDDHDHGNENGEGDKQQSPRRSKNMFQRVGGLLTIRKSSHRKEPSTDPKLTPTQTHPPQL